jgi:hypothetical protein
VRLVNEVRTVTLALTDDREVAARVRVRGIDARVGRQGFVALSQEPLAVVVREHRRERRIRLGGSPIAAAGGALAAAAPVVAYLACRGWYRKQRRSKR